MLKFDSNHKSIDGNINKFNPIGSIKRALYGGMALISMFVLTGCIKDVPCNIEENHAHYYVNDANFGRYIMSEKEKKDGLDRTDKYIYVDDIELYNFLDKNGLFKIEENIDAINDAVSKKKDYYKYYYDDSGYKWEYGYGYGYKYINGKWGYQYGYGYGYVYRHDTGWTTNPNHAGVTGKKKLYHPMYYGYKVVKDEKGNYNIVKSELVDNIFDLPSDYKYIKSEFSEDVEQEIPKIGYSDLKNENDFSLKL